MGKFLGGGIKGCCCEGGDWGDFELEGFLNLSWEVGVEGVGFGIIIIFFGFLGLNSIFCFVFLWEWVFFGVSRFFFFLCFEVWNFICCLLFWFWGWVFEVFVLVGSFIIFLLCVVFLGFFFRFFFVWCFLKFLRLYLWLYFFLFFVCWLCKYVLF